jgi:hypothetical protein
MLNKTNGLSLIIQVTADITISHVAMLNTIHVYIKNI